MKIPKRKTKALDQAVEMALYSLATGAATREEKKVYKNGELIEIIETEKTHEPNLKAIQLWLSTKMPETWGEITNQPDNRIDEILQKMDELAREDEE